jgi:hypothetical protein
MKSTIYKYTYNGKVHYAEGYNEPSIRTALENYLHITPGTLSVGVSPALSELKLIWDRSNKTHRLTLSKEQTTPREQLEQQRKKQHAIHELRQLLREDEKFLNGMQGHIIANEENEVRMWNSKVTFEDGIDRGHEMCYTFRGSRDPDMTDSIYRFKRLSNAYKHVRSELIRLGIQDEMFNKNFTTLEICDSFIAGFGNADLYQQGKDIMVKSQHQINQSALKQFAL